MEKNKLHLEDAFLKKYVQEINLDKTNSDFTSNLMNAIHAEEKQLVLKSEPLISKKLWMITFGFVAICLWFLLKGESTNFFEFSKPDFSFLSKIQIPNLLENLSISKTMFYSIVIFSIMVFAQIFYLKNHFNKRFD